jgi:HEPN domain-containing protein
VPSASKDVEWTTERCLSLVELLIEGELLELATSRARQSFATRLAKRLRDNDGDDELADWIVEQAEVVELHATDEELHAAMRGVTADELDDDAGDDDAGS